MAGGFEPAPPLEGSAAADVCIVGGGYTGLWTALRLKELEPSLDVTIVEADICGGGASGRNGGFVLTWWPKFATLAKQGVIHPPGINANCLEFQSFQSRESIANFMPQTCNIPVKRSAILNRLIREAMHFFRSNHPGVETPQDCTATLRSKIECKIWSRRILRHRKSRPVSSAWPSP